MDERDTFLNLAQTMVAIVLDQPGVNKNIEGSLHRYETDPPDQDQGFALETLQDAGYFVISANDVAETDARYLYQLTYEEESVLHPVRGKRVEDWKDGRSIITTTDFLEVLVCLKCELEA